MAQRRQKGISDGPHFDTRQPQIIIIIMTRAVKGVSNMAQRGSRNGLHFDTRQPQVIIIVIMTRAR
jgi:hypothetical protein